MPTYLERRTDKAKDVLHACFTEQEVEQLSQYVCSEMKKAKEGKEDMGNLIIMNQGDALTLDSREVAEWVGKDHKNLLADIRGYVDLLEKIGELKVQPTDFFVESTYISEQNKALPCYLLTKKGCDMVANKMTGEKGVKFSAMYINRFYEMEQAITAPKALSPLEQLQLQVQVMQELTQKQEAQQVAIEATNQRIDNIGEIIALNPTAWREDAKNMIVRIARALGGDSFIPNVQIEIYALMKSRFGFDLKRRQTNKRAKMALEGANKTQQAKVSKVDVIADDKRAVEAYLTIIKELAIKHGVDKSA